LPLEPSVWMLALEGLGRSWEVEMSSMDRTGLL
jgi:hypothetical protein